MMTAGQACAASIIAAAIATSPTSAYAQLDPLLFLKTAKPNVLIVVDTRSDMLRDANDDYYDGFTYKRTGADWEASLGLAPSIASGANYRRKYIALRHADPSAGGEPFTAQAIQAVGETDAAYAPLWSRTRFEVARTALLAAVDANREVVRFGLLRTRQGSPAWGQPERQEFVRISLSNAAQQSPTETGRSGVWFITRPTVGVANGSLAGIQSPIVMADVSTASRDVIAALDAGIGVGESLIPSGLDSATAIDAPVEYMLEDARAEAERLTAADTDCRNTVVVLMVGGQEGATAGSRNPVAKAAQFLGVSGHRVPIYVVAIAPPADAVGQLRAIATTSGGQFFEITGAMIDATTPGSAVPEATRAVNLAVQHAFASRADVDSPPTVSLPSGPSTEFQVTSPVVGTTDLDGARDITGLALADTRVRTPNGSVIPQRSNLLITTAMALPGFEAKLRAFRVYHPVADATAESGYAFVSDGARLWVASAPAPSSRNIFTVLPGSSALVPFTTDNAGPLAPFLNAADPAGLIDYIRALPVGAPLSSTPAVMSPPFMDPPPDKDYPAFAAAHTNRRGLVWVGTNDGMLHAIDSRLGVEVWAFIPSNLLPKLKALQSGQAVGRFNFFVDASPRVADVKVGGAWRSYLIVGEGAGGTFYQTFDVTLDGVSTCVASDSDSVPAVLSCFADPNRIRFKWSFPDYAHFDYTMPPYGELDPQRASATEKTVGQTWSQPAIGQVQDASGRFVVIAGSGFLPYSTEQTSRGGLAAGNSLYILSVADGSVYDSRSVGSDGVGETIDDCAAIGDCSALKNALQADPAAIGSPDLPFVTRIYVGDLDGRLWRFDLGSNPTDGNPVMTADPVRIFDGSGSNPIFSSVATAQTDPADHYVFFGTGNDLLPSRGVHHQYRLLGVLDGGAIATQKFAELLAITDGADDDEHVSGAPVVAGDVVFFSTTRTRPQEPCSPPEGTLRAMTFAGGPAYDSSGDGVITGADTRKVHAIVGARASAPFVVDRHVVLSAGGQVEIFGDPRGYNNGIGRSRFRVLSWREVR